MRKNYNDPVQIFDTPQPNTESLERQVLADALTYPELLGDVIPVIHPSFFTNEDRASIWDLFVKRHNAGEAIDMTLGMTIGIERMKAEILPYMEDVTSGAEAIFHAYQLRDGAAKRRAYMAAANLILQAVKPGVGEQDLLAAVEAATHEVEGPAPLQGEIKLDKVLTDVRAQIETTQQAIKEGKTTRISTGFKCMDIYLNGGFKSGQLVILAARPSVGKTAVMLQMAKAAAAAKNNVQVFSLEMQAEELGERLMYSTGIVTPAQVNFGKTDPSALDQAEKMLNPLPLYINDFSRSLDDIVSRLTQAVKKNRCNIAFIDYLGLMQDALNGGNVKLYQVIARITGTLKAVAKRLQIPIILLCQINRESAREGRSPELFDLRDSGSIEQDADVVLMLESKMTPEQKLYVWLRKNRAGKKEVTFVLTPNKTYSEFTEDGVIMPGEEGVQTPPPDPNHRPLYEYAEERESTEDLPF